MKKLLIKNHPKQNRSELQGRADLVKERLNA
jgi:hypothetical protein